MQLPQFVPKALTSDSIGVIRITFAEEYLLVRCFVLFLESLQIVIPAMKRCTSFYMEGIHIDNLIV